MQARQLKQIHGCCLAVLLFASTAARADASFTYIASERAHTALGHCVDLTITNTGSQPGTWNIEFDLPIGQDILNSWNVNLHSPVEGRIALSPAPETADWGPNSHTLAPGASTPSHEFGYCVQYLGSPGDGSDNHSDTMDYTSTVKDQWDSGYCVDLQVTNNGSESGIWAIATDISSDSEIFEAWNIDVQPQLYGNGIRIEPESFVQGWNDGNYWLNPGEQTASEKFGYCVESRKVASSMVIDEVTDEGYFATITVRNISGSTLDNWATDVKVYGVIDSIANARFNNTELGFARLQNLPGSSLAAGQTQTIQITVTQLVDQSGAHISAQEWYANAAPASVTSNFFTQLGVLDNYDPETGMGTPVTDQMVQDKIRALYTRYFRDMNDPLSTSGLLLKDQMTTTDGTVPSEPMECCAYIRDPQGSSSAGAGGEDTGPNVIKTEGISYGMLIALAMNDQETFHRLWRFATNEMQHHNSNWPNYFSWLLAAENHPRVLLSDDDDDANKLAPYEPLDSHASNPAPDGENYFATALLLATIEWARYGEAGPQPADDMDYLWDAHRIIDEMFTGAACEENENRFSNINCPLFNSPADNASNTTSYADNNWGPLLVFSPNGSSFRYTNPSYHTPVFLHLWNRTIENPHSPRGGNYGILDAAEASVEYLLHTAAQSEVGLFPERSEFDGTPISSASDFHWDAWRNIQNLALYYHWVEQDPRIKEVVMNMLRFFHEQRDDTGVYGSGFTLEGNQIDGSRSRGLVAMNAVGAALVIDSSDSEADRAMARQFLQDLWDLWDGEGNPFTGGNLTGDYYHGLLYTLGMMHVSGQLQLPRSLLEREPF